MKRLNGTFAYLGIIGSLMLAACQRDMTTNKSLQTQLNEVGYQAALVANNAKTFKGIKSSSNRGAVDYSNLANTMSAPYNNNYMTASNLTEADACYTYIATITNQLAANQIPAAGFYDFVITTLFQCELRLVQQGNAYGSAVYRSADSQTQGYLNYLNSWSQYGSYTTYSQNSYPWANQYGSNGTLVNQQYSGSNQYQYPYQSYVSNPYGGLTY